MLAAIGFGGFVFVLLSFEVRVVNLEDGDARVKKGIDSDTVLVATLPLIPCPQPGQQARFFPEHFGEGLGIRNVLHACWVWGYTKARHP